MGISEKVKEVLIKRKKLLRTVAVLCCCLILLLIIFRTRNFFNPQRDEIMVTYISHTRGSVTDLTEILDTEEVIELLSGMRVYRTIDVPPAVWENYDCWEISISINDKHWHITLGNHDSYIKGPHLYYWIRNPEEIIDALNKLQEAL